MAMTTAEITWLTILLTDLRLMSFSIPILYCEMMSALHLCKPSFHARTKHIKIDYHYVREQVALKKLETQFVPTGEQIADIFTKPLPLENLQKIVSKLGLCSSLQFERGGGGVVRGCIMVWFNHIL